MPYFLSGKIGIVDKIRKAETRTNSDFVHMSINRPPFSLGGIEEKHCLWKQF